jgi:hypothetical protein
MKTIEDIADIVELQTWASEKPTSISTIKEELEAVLDDASEEDPEALAQNIIDEFVARQQLLGDAYPFVCDGYKLDINQPEPQNKTYLFCLALSQLPASEIENEQRAQQFETIVKDAATKFFGGVGLRIGAPWRTEEVQTYSELLDRVIELIPNLGERLRDTAPGGGDAGWDLLVVKSFRDDLFPRFIALGNCATGRRDWKRKGMEVQPTLWWSYFRYDHRSVHITFFAVPFTMDEDARLRKLSSTNLTFDRFRICELAPDSIADAAIWVTAQRANAMNIAWA